MNTYPILYSFRRCPYAIRARLAFHASRKTVELREIVLRDKAPDFLKTSPSATVPCLKEGNFVLDESLDIMLWTLRQSDPEHWLRPEVGTLDDALELIEICDGPFKHHLDRYKYDTRYQDADRETERSAASDILWRWEKRLSQGSWLMGKRASLADYAILPFVRQFANSDRTWFDGEAWNAIKAWLGAFETSEQFQAVMPKWSRWQAGDAPVLFPVPSS
ncbi:glutathione S-transferase [uncultured Roseibium sp.]|uniref:glutathione S-transferase n=1 Tax=uncultured Roseibium sp. TaxID=1936171 RepID=UPI0026398AA0|nr:glutathione S-transferase [uncultured Roseibium sp.]